MFKFKIFSMIFDLAVSGFALYGSILGFQTDEMKTAGILLYLAISWFLLAVIKAYQLICVAKGVAEF